MMEFTFEITEQEIQDQWASQTTPERWIEMYRKLSASHSTWSADIKVAEFIINHIKEYVERLPKNLPEVLYPLLVGEIKNDIKDQNERNKGITLEEVAGEAELKAIELLRDYDFITYNDAVNIMCDMYKFGIESTKNNEKALEDYTTTELLEEVKRRL